MLSFSSMRPFCFKDLAASSPVLVTCQSYFPFRVLEKVKLLHLKSTSENDSVDSDSQLCSHKCKSIQCTRVAKVSEFEKSNQRCPYHIRVHTSELSYSASGSYVDNLPRWALQVLVLKETHLKFVCVCVCV